MGLRLPCRHAKELQEQHATAAAAAEVAALQHKQQLQQLQTMLEEQSAAAADQANALQQQANQLQDRLAAVSQQLLSVLQLPQGLGQQQQQHRFAMPGVHNAMNGSPHSQPHSPGAGRVSVSPSPGRSMQQQQQQPPGFAGGSPGSPVVNPIGFGDPQFMQNPPATGVMPQEAIELSAALTSSLSANPNASPEEAAGAVQVLVLGLSQQLQTLATQLLLLQQENDQLQQDGFALAADFEACATNLQSLVATVAFSIPVTDEVQQGLNSRDAAVFDEQLAALHEVSSMKQHLQSSLQA